MDNCKILFFLEDNAQESFIPPLVERLIIDIGGNIDNYDLQVLSARGGGSIRAYKDFIKLAKKGRHPSADLLIVGSDGNCNGFNKRRQQLLDASKGVPFLSVIPAVPDPHIERWYLLDNSALAAASGIPVQAVPPTIKCDKNHYKQMLKDVFYRNNLLPPLGGTEYGPLVTKTMDLYAAGNIDHALRDFVMQVRSWLRQHNKISFGGEQPSSDT